MPVFSSWDVFDGVYVRKRETMEMKWMRHFFRCCRRPGDAKTSGIILFVPNCFYSRVFAVVHFFLWYIAGEGLPAIVTVFFDKLLLHKH